MTLSEPYKNKAIFKVEVFVVLEEIRVLQSIHTPEDIPVKSVKTLNIFRNRRGSITRCRGNRQES